MMDSDQKAKPTGESGSRKRGRDQDDNNGRGSSKRYDAGVLATMFPMDSPTSRSKTADGPRYGSEMFLTPCGKTTMCSVKSKMPPRLFAEDKIPSGGRINAYSKPDYLGNLTQILHGTDEFDCIKESQFGALFEIQSRKAVLSGKLVHQFLCRSLMTRKKHEHWFVFGGRPIRFSLKEFGYVTGLNCDPYPENDPMAPGKEHVLGKDSFWRKLIGERDHCPVADIIEMLHSDKKNLRKIG